MTTVLQENDSKFVERVSEIKFKKWFHKLFSTPEPMDEDNLML